VLALRSLGSHSVFELRAGKRGSRLGWKEADGETRSFSKVIAHANEPAVICWRNAEESEIPRPVKGKHVVTKEDLMAHVPAEKPISKETLRSKANAAGIALNSINAFIAELIDEGVLYQWLEKRRGTNPRKLLSRRPQPSEDLLQ
jgi:hypothetical protein